MLARDASANPNIPEGNIGRGMNHLTVRAEEKGC
jgi:hypothetical protein